MYNETISESSTKENDGDGGSKDVKETENKIKAEGSAYVALRIGYHF